MCMVSQVDDHLYLSSIGGTSKESLLKHNITCVINATKEATMPPEELQIDCIRVAVDDYDSSDLASYFDTVVNKIVETNEKGGNTLVHCMAGVSRSASLCLAYLMKHKGMNLREAYYFLKKRRALIHPNVGFFKQLIEYEKKLYGKGSVVMVKHFDDFVIPDVYVDQFKHFIRL